MRVIKGILFFCMVFVFLIQTYGCYKAPKQSALMKEYGTKGFTALELKIRLNNFAIRFRGNIEKAADEIIAKTEDPKVKKNALLWKIYSITTSQNAIYLADPAAAVLDVWTFCIQMRLFFAEGAGSKAFGNLQGASGSAQLNSIGVGTRVPSL